MSDDDSKKWRCAWCGKPHARNDPPCDECGHHKFEKAVVPVAPEDPEHVPEPIWVCPECGREHMKNSPPCSRCGHASLEKRTPDYSELDDLGAPSYVELLEPRYVVGVVLALAAGGLLVLGVAGVGPLAGIGGPDLTVADVPGDADRAGELELSAVESAYVAELSVRRPADTTDLERVDRLDDVARYYNQRRVKSLYANGTLPSDRELGEALGGVCEQRPSLVPFATPAVDSGDPSIAAASLLDDAPSGTTSAGGASVGVDVHAGPDGRLYVTQVTC